MAKTNSQKIKDSEALSKQHEIVDMEKAHNRCSNELFKKLDSLMASWTGPIYEQVNEYIKNYSLENGYDYVLGNLGNGNVMYGNPTHNITLEVIDAINVATTRENKSNSIKNTKLLFSLSVFLFYDREQLSKIRI